MGAILKKHRHILPIVPFIFLLLLAELFNFWNVNISYAGVLTRVDVQPASLFAGATSTVTITFTTSASGSIPKDGKVRIGFANTWDLTGITTSSGSCSSMDGGVNNPPAEPEALNRILMWGAP